MFIIFGYRTLLKNFGEVFKNMCAHCHNEKYWVLTRTSKWFTLFFIPIVPISSTYFLSCPVCKYGTKLNHEQVEKMKPIAEANALLTSGMISEQQYRIRLGLPSSETGAASLADGSKDSGPTPAIVTSYPGTPSKTIACFCKNCGTRFSEEERFCRQCGSSLKN
jgi:hypothetical protein